MTYMTQNDLHDSKWLILLKVTYMTQDDFNDSKCLKWWLKMNFMTQNDLHDSNDLHASKRLA